MSKHRWKYWLLCTMAAGATLICPVLLAGQRQKNFTTNKAQEKFLSYAGTDIYMYARNRGYSVFGAQWLLAMAADKTGYGDMVSVNRAIALNNFWQIKRLGETGYMHFETAQEGIKAGLDILQYEYPALAGLLKGDSTNLHKMDKVINSYTNHH